MPSIVGGLVRYPPEADHLRLPGHGHRRGEAGAGRPGRPGALAGLAGTRFDRPEEVAFAAEACTGWRYVAEELAAAGIEAHLAEPAGTAAARGRKKHAKTDRADARLQRDLLAQGRLPECWIPPAHVLECRALLECYHGLRRQHTAWVFSWGRGVRR